MARVLIRNIPEETLAVHRERSRRNGISPEKNRPCTPEERVAITRYLHSRSLKVSPALTLDEIRDGLE